MAFTTFLFGNGLGRAVDNEYFELKNGLAHGWNSTWQLTQEDKNAILECLPGRPDEIAIDEGHLELLHEIANSCGSIHQAILNPNLILTEPGLRLPSSVHRLVSQVGWYYHDYVVSEGTRFDSFIKRLIHFIENQNTHLATLNYDNLLYNAMIEAEILQGYSGKLIDGFTRAGTGDLKFADDNLDRFRANLGFYLHLHGSPLFISKNDRVIKQEQGVRIVGCEPHMVLHHVNQKRSVITRSYLLTSYWKRFDQALLQSNAVVIIGYGGSDIHVNDLIASRKNSVGFGHLKIFLIERSAAGTAQTRKAFWTAHLKTEDIQIIQLDNILDFDFNLLGAY